jgi:O-antigen ligase
VKAQKQAVESAAMILRLDRFGVLVATLTIVTAVLLGALAASSPTAAVIPVAVIAALAALILLAQRSSALIALGLLLLIAGLAVPTSAGIVATVALVTFVAWRTAIVRDSRAVVGACCLVVMTTWLLLGANPNIQDFHTVLLGTRKTTLVFIGIGVGALWPTETRRGAEQLIVGLLIGAAVLCLLIHFGDPAYENSLPRGASIYTSLFQGELRMQGIYSGPFHIAVLGTFLCLRGWHLLLIRRPRWQALCLIALGGIVVLEADVRTAFVTIALGVALTLVLRPPKRIPRANNFWKTVAAGGVVLLLTASGALGQNAALSSLSELSSASGFSEEQRADTRLVSWSTAVGYFRESPVVGLGPGSAGAALGGSEYHLDKHVTSDNEYLAVLVEGGVIGVIVVLLAFWALARYSTGLLEIANPSCAAALALFGFAFTGNVFETLPISLFLCVLLGLRVPARPATR